MRAGASGFDAALGDDLNTPEALAAVHVLVREAQRAARRRARDARGRGGACGRSSRRWTRVFGVLLPPARTA